MASNSILDSFDPKGHIEIFKIYPNGRRELFYSDHNEITVGMGITLASLYSAPKTDPLDDYQISHFQVGTGTATPPFSGTFTLGTPFEFQDYGSTPNVNLEARSVYNEGTNPVQALAEIGALNVVSAGKDKVKCILTLDKSTANDTVISELGLFSRDPLGINASTLIAYRSLPAVITKTSGFAITINWTLNF